MNSYIISATVEDAEREINRTIQQCVKKFSDHTENSS